MSDTQSPETTKDEMVADVQARIAVLVRQDSQKSGKLTNTDSLTPLFKDFRPDQEVQVDLEAMIREEQYQDIHLLITSADAMYLYSATYIAENDAERLLQSEELCTNIAAKIREDSKNLAQLTSVDSLSSLLTDPDAEDIEPYLAEMANDERYQDIQKIVISTGAVYLYSETSITQNYAVILGRAAANDPAATIAETVREESKIYPRPTNIDLFKDQVFNVSPDELETFITQTLEQEDFQDIKLILASTGARYLYSDQFMNADYAQSLVEWQEVGEQNNP